MSKEKSDQLLDEAIKQIEKQYGKGSIMRLGDRTAVDVDAISSGSLAIDLALGIGAIQKDGLLKSMVLNQVVKQP